MFIQRNTKRVGSRVYHSVLLREGYRENGKVKMRTLLNLSGWSEEKIEGLRRVITGEQVSSLDEVEVESGRSFGCLYALKTLSDRLGITASLGGGRRAALTLLMVFGRIISQGSKLATVNWATGQATEEVLELSRFDEDDLYETLDWLEENQEEIEEALFLARKARDLFLYDVTSSYLEGEKNELAEYGYNRDGKKGKKQIVIGLLTDKEGYPLSSQLFKGSTSDIKTISPQIKKLKERFKAEKITLVGDKGLIKEVTIKHLKEEDFSFITSITKPEIESLIKEDVIQLSLFEEELAEVEHEGIRYILRRNPQRAEETTRNRKERVEKAENKLKEEASLLLSSNRRDPNKVLRRATVLVEKLKLSKFITLFLKGRKLTYHIDQEVLERAESLDGCYVIKTDLSKERMSAAEIHNRYKDLTQVEQAFRTMKTGLLEIRPLYHRKASRTKGHVFVTMLAYGLTYEIRRLTKPLGLTTKQMISLLNRIQINQLKLGEVSIKKVTIPDVGQAKVLNAWGVQLPKTLKPSKVNTKKPN